MNIVVFDFPTGWQIGLPLAVLALGLSAWALSRRRLGRARVAGLTALRAVALFALVFLVSKPMWVSKEPPSHAIRPVVLLMDRSESMSLEEGEKSRYRQALDFARDQLLPALKATDVPVQAFLFAEDAVPADGEQLNAEAPKGKRTNLGGAIARAFASTPSTPLAVIALTDGVANESADNARGLTALVEARAPFVGVGFGTDLGARTLSLRQVEAPTVVATNTLFRVTAHLELQNSDETPPFDLVLMREGQVAQRKTVNPGKGSRAWLESFEVSETTEGTRVFTVQFLPPSAPGLKCVNTMGSATVRVANEKELRVLYVQGALTWDYKFFALALKGDPTIKLTGLTRTSKQSVFRQNVETAGELKHGFPVTVEEIAPFRAVVLANLTPLDLSPVQQDLLARYCGELGGGVLMMGGPATFNLAWRGSRLEQMMPVTFAAGQGVTGLDRPFRLRLTDDALQHPLFQIANDRPSRETWAQLPPFNQYGRVDGVKAGAQIWAEHPDDQGPKGKRILMASQRFGAGVSAAICMQNLWRWRLAKDGEPAQFDRFWRQLIRFLSEPSRQEVLIQLADQELHPQMDVQLTVEKQPRASDIAGARQRFTMVVEDELKKTVATQTLELTPGRAMEMSFRAERAGLYAVKALDANGVSVASRVVEIRDVNLEFADTGRNIETLRQWASVSDGLALRVEDCPDAEELVAQIRRKVEEARRFKPLRKPAGVNGWMLAAVLAGLGGEWVLRKRWNLV